MYFPVVVIIAVFVLLPIIFLLPIVVIFIYLGSTGNLGGGKYGGAVIDVNNLGGIGISNAAHVQSLAQLQNTGVIELTNTNTGIGNPYSTTTTTQNLQTKEVPIVRMMTKFLNMPKEKISSFVLINGRYTCDNYNIPINLQDYISIEQIYKIENDLSNLSTFLDAEQQVKKYIDDLNNKEFSDLPLSFEYEVVTKVVDQNGTIQLPTITQLPGDKKYV